MRYHEPYAEENVTSLLKRCQKKVTCNVVTVTSNALLANPVTFFYILRLNSKTLDFLHGEKIEVLTIDIELYYMFNTATTIPY